MRKLLALLAVLLIMGMPIVDALTISNVQAIPQATSATVTWQTDEVSSSKVSYGLSPSQLIDGPSSSALVTSHSLVLPGLDDDQTYYFSVESQASDNTVVTDDNDSAYYKLKTKDVSPPARVQNVKLSNPTISGVTLSWAAVSDPDFDHYIVQRSNVKIAETKELLLTDSGLSADTSYQYRIAAVDTSGNVGQYSATQQIRTLGLDANAPTITSISVDVRATSVTITYTTSEDSESVVLYGTSSLLGQEKRINASVSAHSVEITGLEDGKPFYFRLIACDADNNCAQSDIEGFITGEPMDAPTLEFELPSYWNSELITVSGKATPFVRIILSVNGVSQRSLLVPASGEFSLSGVQLDRNQKEAVVSVVARNLRQQEITIEKTIALDFSAPLLTLEPLPEFSKETSVKVEGSVDEHVTLSFKSVKAGQENLAQVLGLKADLEEGGVIHLSWQQVENAQGYVLYRDGKRMTTTDELEFTDPLVSGKQYTYSIAAYNTNCVEGTRSSISVLAGLVTSTDVFEELKEFCETDSDTIEVEGAFSHGVELLEGANRVTITATDRAGNARTIEAKVTLDNVPPTIVSTNLESLNPSYIEDITVKGIIEKTAFQRVLVTVYVNDEPYSDFVKEDGSFNIPVKLDRSIVEEMNAARDYDPERKQSNYYSTFGSSWKNTIRITAQTQSGLESSTPPQDIELTTCGTGSWWKVDLGKSSPTSLVPRLMLEGLAQITIPVNNISWRGSGKDATISHIAVSTSRSLSERDEKQYDTDWVSVQYTPSRDRTSGFVQINVKNLKSAGLVDKKDPTLLDLENMLSDHRLESNCIVPGFGCIRIPLLMEIEYTYPGDNGQYASKDRLSLETGKQKQCWDVEIMVDRRVPSDKIPEAFLLQSIEIIDAMLNAITSLLKPLNTIKQALFYGCGASMVWDFFLAAQEGFACEFTEVLNTASASNGKFDAKVAKVGQCADYYKGTNQDEARANCQSCQDAVQKRVDFEEAMKWVCDRIFCPAAPTYQKYVKDMSKKSNVQLVASTTKPTLQSGTIPEPVSDCSFGNQVNAQLDYQAIFNTYDLYKKDKDRLEKECGVLHLPNAQCCAYEYLKAWDSSCLLMDELKESKCLARQEQNANTPDDDCGTARRLWNALAGFCEADGSPPAEIIATGDRLVSATLQNAPATTSLGQQIIFVAGSSESNAYFRFLDQTRVPNAPGSDAEPTKYYAEIGHVMETAKSSAVEKWNAGEESKVSSQRNFVPEKKGNANWIFVISTKTKNEATRSPEEKIRDDFIKEYMSATIQPNPDRAKEVYRNLQDHLGVSDKENIVDPTSGILRSLQCGCLPGITSYLSLWAKVMDALKLCLETVLATGDGNAGVCQAVLSQYVCDLIYDLISCFTKKYGAGGKRDYTGSIGDYIGALTSAGEKVSSTVEGRYGSSSLWQSMFAEHKLVNSVCLYAFTGTWDFDVSALLEEDISIDVESVIMPFPCERRFISFNPVSNPAGITTHNYHAGLAIVAGSELTYDVKLICSDDYSCDTKTGQCDCANIGKQERSLRIGPGNSARGQTIDDEVYENIEAPYRYDKMVVSWESKDSDKSGKTECSIRQRGGNAPVFCKQEVIGFTCSLGTSSNDYIRFFSDPTPLQDLYYIGDKINVDMRLLQDHPQVTSSPTQNQYTKYMKMTLTNQNGAILNPTDPVYPFNGNGQHDISNLPNHQISQLDFEKMSEEVRVIANSPQLLRYEVKGKLPEHDIYLEFKNGVITQIHYLNETGGVITTKNVKIDQQGQTLIILDGVVFLYFKEPFKDGKFTIRQLSNKSWQCDQTWNLNIKFFNADETGLPTEQPAVDNGQNVEKNVKIKVKCKKDTPSTLNHCPFAPEGKVQTICSCKQLPDGSYAACTPGSYCVDVATNRECVAPNALGVSVLSNPRIGFSQTTSLPNLSFSIQSPTIVIKPDLLYLEVDGKTSPLKVSFQATSTIPFYTVEGDYVKDAFQSNQNAQTPPKIMQLKIFDQVIARYEATMIGTLPHLTVTVK